MDAYIRSLAREYLTLCEATEDTSHDDEERRALAADRTWTHDTLIRLLGPEYERPFDMRAHARLLLR